MEGLFDECKDYKKFKTVENSELPGYVNIAMNVIGTDIQIKKISDTLNEIWFPPDADLTIFE